MAKKYKIEEVVKTEVIAVDETITKTVRVVEETPAKTARKTKEYWNVLGPGLTTGAADDDPSGIATYSQTGAQYGFQLLWLSIFCYPLAAIVQEICARIGLATGRGLATNIRTHFSKRVLYGCTLLLFAANAFNIGADLGAMAKGVQLLSPGFNFAALVIGFAALSVLLQIYLPYAKYAHFL
jgi:NRAMP (natural resistance-associated macrophage protein)-like metal ion transporter